MEPLRLPFAYFSVENPPSNAKGISWELDLQLDEDRPLKFFSLLIFQDGPTDNESIIKELSTRITDTVTYQHQLLKGNQISVTTDDFFEQCLQKINSEISNFLRDISAPLPVHSWAILIGMLTPDENPKRLQFYTSRFGAITGWLLNSAQLDTKKLISIFDVSDALPAHQIPQKFFRNILSSTIPKTDQLFFCSPNLLNYVSLSEIKNVLGTLSINPALKQLENQINFRPSDHIVAGMSIKLSAYPLREQGSQSSLDRNAQVSMDNLLHTQSETQKLLENNVGISLNQITSSFKRAKDKAASAISTHDSEVIPSMQNRKQVSIPMRIMQISAQGISITIRAGSSMVIGLLSKRGGGPKKKGAMELLSTNKTITRTSIWKQHLYTALVPIKILLRKIPLKRLAKNPTFYLVTVILILLFIGVGSFRSARKEKSERLAFAQTTLAEVHGNLDKIDSHLIVGRESDALRLVQDSSEKLANVDGIDEVAEERDQLSAELLTRQSKLRKETLITEPTVKIENLSQFLSSDAHAIVTVDDYWKIIGKNSQKMLSVFKETGAKTDIPLNVDVNSWNDATGLNPPQLLLIQDKAVAIVDGITGEGTSSTTNSASAIKGGVFFNNRIYALAPEQNQIVRSNRAPSYNILNNWLSDQSDSVENARDLAIDGSIYILYPDTVKQFNGGSPARPGINLDPIDPPLTDAQHIYTSDQTNRIFILESNRLIIFEKTGRFIGQYLIEGESGFIDMVFEGNQVLLMTTNRLYEISL